MPRLPWSVALLLTLGLALGCSSEPRTYPVTGTVRFAGKPVDLGNVLFMAEGGARGPDAGKISDGKFALRAAAGKQRVEIRGQRQIAYSKEMGAIFDDYIPAEFNARSALTAEVSSDSANHFDFDLHPVKK